jgi:hypothetical protein
MKKLLAIGLLCLLIGCSESPVDESGRHVAERSGTNEFNMVLVPGNGEQTFRYIMVDGHEYLVMTGCYRSGLTHSPKCPCHKNKAEIVLPLNIVTNDMPQVVPL